MCNNVQHVIAKAKIKSCTPFGSLHFSNLRPFQGTFTRIGARFGAQQAVKTRWSTTNREKKHRWSTIWCTTNRGKKHALEQFGARQTEKKKQQSNSCFSTAANVAN